MKKYYPLIYSNFKFFFFVLLIMFSIGHSTKAQVVLSLDYLAKAGEPSSVPSGKLWTMQLNYSVSSTTTGSATGVKIVVDLPDYIYDASEFVGTVHAPASNFVYDNTTGAKKLTITFADPVASGSTGMLEFKLRSINGTTPNGTMIHSCATMTDGSGASSGQKCHDETITANPILCAFKTLTNGGAIDNVTTYTISLGYDKNTLGYPPFGALGSTNISLTDTYPAGAEIVSVKLNNIATAYSQSGNSLTIAIPDMNSFFTYNGTWQMNTPSIEIALKYNSSAGFSAGQSVTNSASVIFTPLGRSSTTLTNGSNSGGCISELMVNHTLTAPTVSAILSKSSSTGTTTIHPNEAIQYNLTFTNTGNIPLENVEIIETVPSLLAVSNDGYAGYSVFFNNDIAKVSNITYLTNLNTNWTNWAINGFGCYIPNLSTGEYITKIKVQLISPLPANTSIAFRMGFVGNSTATTQVIANCAEWNSTTAGIPSNRTACSNEISIEPTPSTAKVYYNIANLPGCISGSFNLNQILDFSGNVKAINGYAGLQNPTVAMFLPKGFEYVANSETFEVMTSGLPTPILTVTPNFGGGTRTLFRWVFPTGIVLAANTEFKVHVNVKLSNTLVSNTNYSGDTWMLIDGSNMGIFLPEAQYPDYITDQYDWDGDGNTTEKQPVTATNSSSCSLTIGSSASMESIKWVKGLCDTQYSKYPNYGQTVPGGNADYKLIVKNTGNVTMKDIKIIDILPFIGDKGVIDSQPRLTAWAPNLAEPISAPVGITIYYSTSGNPCRDEMKGTSAPSPFPTDCENANWTTTPPTNITAVKSVKIDFGTKTLAGGDSLIFSWPMRAPVTAPTNNEIAWNSFGFVASRTDNNQALIAAEPNKVGIKVKTGTPAYYGNRVWYDTNHDGIQDASEGGVDGVKVKLFKVSSLSATPNPATDQLINFTITGNGGFYKFSNLTAGFYYAVFCVPMGYLISPKNTGTTINDSDGANTTYQGQTATITAVTELNSTEDDDSWDQGIYCNFTPTVTTNSSVAVGGTLTMSVSPATGAYIWAGPNGWTATGASITKTNMQLADAGSYAVNVYQNADVTGCWASLNIDVVVGNTPPCTAVTGANITLNPISPVVAGTTVNLTANKTDAGTPTTYTWASSPNTGFTSTTNQATLTNPTAGTYNFTVTVQNTSGTGNCTATATSSLSVSPSCAINATITQSICNNNGTPTTIPKAITDDYFNVTITATNETSMGMYEIVLAGDVIGTGIYGTNVVISGVGGIFKADGSTTYTLIIRDQITNTCNTTKTTTPVAHCSKVCPPQLCPIVTGVKN